MNDEIIDGDLENNSNTTLVNLSSDSLLDQVEKAEKRIEAVKRIKTLSLKVTNSKDWVFQGDIPYLQCTGSEKIRNLFGINCSLKTDAFKRIQQDKGHYAIEYTGSFSWNNMTIDVIGTASTKRPFFKRYEYKDDVKTEVPPDEIDITDVMKAAHTNLMNNGIKKILGLRNLSEGDLRQAGINVETIERIGFKKENKESKDILREAGKMLSEINSGDQTKSEDFLEELTSFMGDKGMVKGKRTFKNMSEKQLKVVYGKIKTKYAEFKKGKQ
jgi:hypothetical protein